MVFKWEHRHLGKPANMEQLKKVPSKLLTLAILSTLFLVDSDCHKFWQFCGNIDKLPDLCSFDDTFQHLERVGQQIADLGNLMALFSKKKPNFIGGS